MSELSPSLTSQEAEKHERPRFDLSTILGNKVDGIEVQKDTEEMADRYLTQLEKDGSSQAQIAELAWAFRRQLQTDLARVKKEDRLKLFKEDESHAFSVALYRKLIKLSSDTLQKELARHEKEKNEINGTYEEFKSLESDLSSEREKLIALLSEMFKRAGQEPKPVHIAKRAILEAKVSELEEKLEEVKKKNPDVGALIEYDTLMEYATQLRTTGFIWTKSRQKLLQDVLTGALTSRPVAALMGETGTGKTALARAASIELSSREPERTVGGDQEKFVRLLASPAIQEGKTYYEYGPLLRAITGKQSSIDKEPSKGGGIFFDDEFNTRPTSVQRQILKFVSEARAGRKVAVPGTPLVIEVQPGFLYLAAGNPPSERYDREETGIETKREFAGNVLNVDYLEQTKDNPELFQVLLASLMDSKTGRLTSVTKAEVAPHFIKDSATGEFSLDNETSFANGFLYRFASAWGELFKAFSHKDTILHGLNPAKPKAEFYLSTFILDPGVVISWIDQYKASPKDRKNHISQFFNTKLTKYISQFPEDEQTLVYNYLKTFNVSPKEALENAKPSAQVLTPKEIGYLNPNVPRPKEKAAPPTFEAIDYIDPETGDVLLQYVSCEVKGFPPQSKLKRKENARAVLEEKVVLLGLLFDKDTKQTIPAFAIIKSEDGKTFPISSNDLEDIYELDVPPSPPETGTPFTYDKVKAQEYGFSELKVEKHEKSQKIIDAVYTRDPKYVTLHRVGTTDPDSATTPKAVLTVDKYKVNEDVLKQDWLLVCPDLPNIPEKSMWYFQALADHRLSNTIDNDDPNNTTNPTKPHIPKFGKDSFMLAMDFPEFDHNDTIDKQAALTPQTKKILKTLFGTEDPTGLSRDDINSALWFDHENRIQSPKAKAVIQELSQGQNPDDFELRLMRYDEYVRASKTQGYGQKNFWTHFDGYYVRGGGFRDGLIGGNRDYGGSARVDAGLRGDRYDGLASRIVFSRKSKELPPPPPSPESGLPFTYDKVKAQEYGFSELKVEKHEKSQKIIDAVYTRDPKYVTLHRVGTTDPDSATTPKAVLTVDKYKVNEDVLKQDWLLVCPDLPNIPEKSMWYFQALADHRLSNTIDNDDPNNTTNPTKPHIPKFGKDSFMLTMDFQEFDFDNPAEKQAALTPQTKKILKTLFNTEDPTNISRDDVNQALWTDHERRIQSVKALSVISELVPQGEDPNNFELRLMRYDEYARSAMSQGYGKKNLWTHFDGYYAHVVGRRGGLDGGLRDSGGSANIVGDNRGVRDGSLALRLVLSRKS